MVGGWVGIDMSMSTGECRGRGRGSGSGSGRSRSRNATPYGAGEAGGTGARRRMKAAEVRVLWAVLSVLAVVVASLPRTAGGIVLVAAPRETGAERAVREAARRHRFNSKRAISARGMPAADVRSLLAEPAIDVAITHLEINQTELGAHDAHAYPLWIEALVPSKFVPSSCPTPSRSVPSPAVPQALTLTQHPKHNSLPHRIPLLRRRGAHPD